MLDDAYLRFNDVLLHSKMFIGGLNWDTTDGAYTFIVYMPSSVALKRCRVEGLRKYFSQFGKVEACTIMRDAAGRSRCFAFLTFEDPASVNAVMVREHFLDGKIVRSPRSHSSIKARGLREALACPLRRSTLSVPFLGRSTSVRRSSSLAASPGA